MKINITGKTNTKITVAIDAKMSATMMPSSPSLAAAAAPPAGWAIPLLLVEWLRSCSAGSKGAGGGGGGAGGGGEGAMTTVNSRTGSLSTRSAALMAGSPWSAIDTVRTLAKSASLIVLVIDAALKLGAPVPTPVTPVAAEAPSLMITSTLSVVVPVIKVTTTFSTGMPPSELATAAAMGSKGLL